MSQGYQCTVPVFQMIKRVPDTLSKSIIYRVWLGIRIRSRIAMVAINTSSRNTQMDMVI